MTKDYLKGTASFMIALILTLPIYSSFVFAGLKSNGYISGEDNIKGYYRRDENIDLHVDAWIIKDKVYDVITPSQVHLYNSNEMAFNSCTDKGDGTFHCTYHMTSSNPDYPEYPAQKDFSIQIALYNDPTQYYPNGLYDSQTILRGAFDEEAPEIKSFTITPSITNGGNINFNYNVYDHSYSPTDTNRCSGIKKLEFSYNETIFETVELNSQSNQCSASDTISIPINDIGEVEEGTIGVILTVYDNFNQESSTVSQFDYDPNFPIIDLESLEIKDIYGDSIEYIGNDPISGVNISFVIDSDDLDVNNVYGDISEINIDNIPSYNNKQATCVVFEEGYKCSFENVEVKLGQSTVVDITIEAYDLTGNMDPTVLSQIDGIIYDGIGPSTTSIKTDNINGGISYAGASTTFTVELNEDGIGIDKEDIILDLSNIQTGLSKAADECTLSGSQWTCYWQDINSNQNDGEQTVSLSGTDNLGNAITGTTSATVTVDKTAPQVTLPTQVTAIGGGGAEAIPGYIKTGDTLDVTLNIEEKNDLIVYADFSSFNTATGQDKLEVGCNEKEGDNWECDWSSSSINVPGDFTGSIIFNITDIAGNNIYYQEPVEVLDYEDASDVSYWKSKVTCSPSLVDRQITDLVNTRVYCSIELETTGGIDQETLSLNLGRCTDKLENSLGYIENIQLLNAEAGSTEPYLSVDLIKGEMTIDQLSITCPLQIVSRVGTKINREPEIELIDIEIGFYNNPLGEYGDGIQSKIDDAKDDAFDGIWGIIGTLKTIVSYARLICNALHALQKISLLLEVITGTITTAHVAAVGTAVEPIMAAAKTGACTSDTTVRRISEKSYVALDGFCKFINCQMSPKTPDTGEGGGGTGTFENIGDSLGRGEWLKGVGLDMDKAPTSQTWNTLGTNKLSGGKGATGTIEEVFGKQYYQYANARDNLLVAVVTGCLPGVINGLDKYRQILCMYADCLEQNSYNNVPVKVCEDQKSYATCKYIFGEIFAVLPWTALFDYYMGMVRGALSDPITAIVSVYNVWGEICTPICSPSQDASAHWLKNERLCRGLQLLSLLGEIINDVEGVIDSYDQIKNDYCKRIDDDKDED